MRALLRVAAAGIAAAGIAALLGCATTGSAPSGAAAPPQHGNQAAALPGKPGCFFLSNFQGSWEVLSNDELIVYAPLYANPYLIKLFEPIPTLPFAQRLGFRDIEHTGMICDNADDDVVVPNWQPHDIPIVALHQLTVQQAAQLLRSHALKSPYRNEKAGNAASSAPPPSH